MENAATLSCEIVNRILLLSLPLYISGLLGLYFHSSRASALLTLGMDAGAAFRQGLDSVTRAREQRTPRIRESSHESNSEEPSTRMAHTLAACCRCRQVSCPVTNHMPTQNGRRKIQEDRPRAEERNRSDKSDREKHAAIQHYPAASLASARAHLANTSTPQKTKRYHVPM